ncbi:putative trna-dihydrouridine synthase 1 [Diaporthe ampelina]|uniref:tRNA-dihydrouridine(16/17) synthase [NAD(P)(+)] n=1 Tax=Diaporthe ampelina TaxID=1214573 RepID=A0A0G2HLV2_9PEZI|nr:putative trna-dihydrouridine synthase 1 [Diaporthe ampelina]
MAEGIAAAVADHAVRPAKLHGRAFYESIGSPRYIVAPMVDQSEFAWRMLSRSFLPESERPSILAYSPMLHARLFTDGQKYRDSHFQPTRSSKSQITSKPQAGSTAGSNEPDDKPYLDGNPAIDRPLFVQFCANDPEALLSAAKLVAPHCDAVDLNLGCPQGIARKGHYGAFLQEDQELIHAMIKTLHENLPVPVTAKIRILETKEATLAYSRNVLSAGASILTVHGRRREQKGHITGVADWEYIRHLRDNLPPETVIFANGNVLQHEDLRRCLDATGADGVMAAEGNLSDPALFASPPPPGEETREYWRGMDGRGGFRVDAIMRRYLDIMHRYVLEQEPPARRPLFVPGDDESWLREQEREEADGVEAQEPARKKRRKDGGGAGGGAKVTSVTAGPNFVGMQPHLFHLLRHFVTRHHDVRDALAKSRLGDMAVYEGILTMVERKVAEGLLEYERTGGRSVADHGRNGAYEKGSWGDAAGEVVAAEERDLKGEAEEEVVVDDPHSSVATVKRCKRPWWIAQPIVRPLPAEALAKGAISLGKKDKKVAKKKAGAEGLSDAAAPAIRADENGTAGQAAESLEKTTDFADSNLVSG